MDELATEKSTTATAEAAERQKLSEETFKMLKTSDKLRDSVWSNKHKQPTRYGEQVKHSLKKVGEQAEDGDKLSDELQRVSLAGYGT